ncbi:MAG: D-alanyl-D-alanine carboxypeptidase/D-alanyl-D-alanine-endopeptidase [Chitinophagaceae bacterium]|nr:MAG: D-alanyl-D-alanine carboxypeptidase/D-alanyl-D-alanine-endopeptidase [Chitinophagaceae bacterium]
MKTIFFALTLTFITCQLYAQSVNNKLTKAWTAFENDVQLKSGLASLYVIDAETGKIVFDKNSYIGLAPASTQKIITSASAYELLGKEFRYTTTFGQLGGNRSNGDIYIRPAGDPTLGSWRWKKTSEDSVIARIRTAINKTGLQSYNSFVVDASGWEGEAIPGGWVWDDIGNYYGAGADVLNWRENQYDLVMKSGKAIGDPVTIVGTKPKLYNFDFVSNVISAAKGTGDNSYIYFPVATASAIVRGTIPVDEDRFTISGAMPSGKAQFLATLADTFSKRGIKNNSANQTIDKFSKLKAPNGITVFHTEISPPLDSIVYWFLKRSINLYGEALAKTIASQKGKTATSDNGAEEMQDWWSKKGIGIDKTELNITDGSGLSPLNRTTTHAQVTILNYAKSQPWFSGYYYAFPEFNGMKLKSGTISRVKSFAGYHTAKDGKQYILSFIVNNYNGSSSLLVQKMYKVLDVLK